MSATPELRLAMLGMIPGNGHPYSWSAIVNGYDPALMASCPFPVIPQYLGKQPLESVGIPGARVTHIWTDDPADAPRVAAASLIPNVVSRPEDVIGHVDAVIIATDDGDDHVRRAAPFLDAGLPTFVDKPLAVNMPDLRRFVSWHRAGLRLLSTSGMRYQPETRAFAEMRDQLGDLRWITSFTCKSWERYGIHALEALAPLAGQGWESVRTVHQTGSDIIWLRHKSGLQATIAAIEDAGGSFGSIHAYGVKSQHAVLCRDTYTAFREQLLAFIQFVQTGVAPFPFDETIELMLVLIAGIRSRDQSGAEISIAALRAELLDES